MTKHLLHKIMVWPGVALMMAAGVTASAGDSVSTRATVENLMRAAAPKLTYTPELADSAGFYAWQTQMKSAMARLMRHPESQAAEPVLDVSRQRDGYRIERWLSYPLEGSVVPFYVMIPDGVDAANPAAAVLCIPGFGQTKELLAGEYARNFDLSADSVPEPTRNAMGLHMVKEGLVAVVVDNPSCGELSDNGVNDYVNSSRFLLELGWSYLGLASWQDKVVIDWMKTQPVIRPDRIIVSGFSLGTEPLMALAMADDSIYAFVYNDFLCRTRERALVMNKPDARGNRPFPNNIEHLIPEFLTEFDFPDIVAAMAPRPVICTEGGMDRDFRIIEKAYEAAGAPANFVHHHYAKYSDPADRVYTDELPNGIDRDEFFRLANVDPPHHYFKTEHVIPWLRTLDLK